MDLGERIVKNGPKMRDYVSIGERLVLTIVFHRAIGVMCQTFKREAGEAVLRFPGSSILNQVMVAQRLGKWRGRQNQQTWSINRLNIVLQHVTTCYQKKRLQWFPAWSCLVSKHFWAVSSGPPFEFKVSKCNFFWHMYAYISYIGQAVKPQNQNSHCSSFT